MTDFKVDSRDVTFVLDSFITLGTNGGSVTSVFGRAGVVEAQVGDYTPSQVGADPEGSAASVQSNLTAHENAADPHPQYLQTADLGTISSQDADNVSITGGTAQLDSVQLLGGTGTQGTVTWDADEETLALIQNGNTLQVGQENQFHCRNGIGSTILKGTPVMAIGTVGGSGRILVGPMDGTTPLYAKYLLGITSEDIATGEDGKVMSYGKLKGVDTLSWPEGSVLWVSSTVPGGLTHIEPPISDIGMPIAFVINSAANGTFFTRITPIDEHLIPTDYASSVFGRTGAVTALLNDYAASLIDNDSTVTGTTVKDALETLESSIPSVPVDSVFGRIGIVIAALNDYAASLIDNDSTVTGATVKDALETLESSIPSIPVDSVFGRIGTVIATLNDYAASLIDNNSTVTGATVKDALETLESSIPNVPVDSVFGRTGAVVATQDDYTTDLVDNVSTVSGANTSDALESLKNDIDNIPEAPIVSVFGRAGTIIATLADYTASLIDNDSTVTGSTVKDALEFLKTYADGLLAANDAMIFKGTIDASTNPNYPAASAGHTYRISVAGKIGGASGDNVEIDDTAYCLVDDTPSGDQATVGNNWAIIQGNIDGAVIGPVSTTANAIALFNGTTGKLIQDSLKTIVETIGSDHTTVPTSQAVIEAEKLQHQVTRLLATSVANAEAQTYVDNEICIVPDVGTPSSSLIYQYNSTSTDTTDHIKVLDVANATGRLLLVENYASEIQLEDSSDFYSTANVECGLQEAGEHIFDITDDTALHRFNVSETIISGVWTVTITQPDALNLEFNIGLTRLEHTSSTMSVDCTSHAGTDAFPKSVFVYVIDNAGSPLLTCSNISPVVSEIEHVDAAIYKAGAVSTSTRTEYGAFIEELSSYEFMANVFHRFLEEGTRYVSGLNTTSSQTDVSVGIGQTKLVFKKNTTVQAAVVANSLFHILDNGTFVTQNNFNFSEYSSGESITTNKYFNVTIGIVSNGETKICAIVQNKGISEYSSTSNAETDAYNTILLRPSDGLVDTFFIPVCRVVVQKTANNYLQVLSNGSYHTDLRGIVSTGGGAASTGSNVVNGVSPNDVALWNTTSGQYEPATVAEAKEILGIPFDRVSAHRDGVDQSIPSSTSTYVSFTTEDYDTGSFFNTTNSRFTPPSGRVFRITYRVRFEPPTSTSCGFELIIRKSGTIYLREHLTLSGTLASLSISTIVVGDGSTYYELQAQHFYGSSINITGEFFGTNFQAEELMAS